MRQKLTLFERFDELYKRHISPIGYYGHHVLLRLRKRNRQQSAYFVRTRRELAQGLSIPLGYRILRIFRLHRKRIIMKRSIYKLTVVHQIPMVSRHLVDTEIFTTLPILLKAINTELRNSDTIYMTIQRLPKATKPWTLTRRAYPLDWIWENAYYAPSKPSKPQ